MDLIDKRDQREKIARAIIKRRNVIYSPVAYTGAAQEEPQAEPQKTAAAAASGPVANAEAMEVLARLEREAAEDEAAKMAEIAKAVAERDAQQEAINRILNEKENSRQQVMAEVRAAQ